MTKHLPLAFSTELSSFKMDKSEILISMAEHFWMLSTVSNASTYFSDPAIKRALIISIVIWNVVWLSASLQDCLVYDRWRILLWKYCAVLSQDLQVYPCLVLMMLVISELILSWTEEADLPSHLSLFFFLFFLLAAKRAAHTNRWLETFQKYNIVI